MLQLSSYQTYTGGNSISYSKDGYDQSITLSTDDMKNYLTNLQSYLNSTDTSFSGTSDSLKQALSSIKENLASFNSTTATDDQVTKLYDQTTQILESAKPKRNQHDHNNLTSVVNTALDMANSIDQGNTVSVDDMKSFLTMIVDKLTSTSTNNTNSTSGSTSSSDLKTSLQNILTGQDISNAANTDIQNLFTKVLNVIKTAVDQQQSGNERDNDGDDGVQATRQMFRRPFFPSFNLTPTSSNIQTSNTTSDQTTQE